MKATEFILDTIQDIKSWSSVDTSSTVQLRMNYLVNTDSSPVTLTIPQANKTGDQIIIKDQSDSFATNNCLLSAYDNIQGVVFPGFYICMVSKAAFPWKSCIYTPFYQ